MIQSTFLHLPKVGPVLERRLWRSGFRRWEQLWTALTSGILARECVREPRQPRLFSDPLPASGSDHDSLTLAWIYELDQSRIALEARNYQYFLQRLRPSTQWRLLPEVLDDALFLDIETTGMSREHHYVTVVGALHKDGFHQWTWPQPPTSLGELMKKASAVVTFNGTRFDLPFLYRQIPSLPHVKAHIDLRYIAHAAGLRGSQKEVERACGMLRDSSIDDYDGEKAVFSWCASLYGDENEYQRLLQYNRADVEALRHLCGHLYTALCRRSDAPVGEFPPIRTGYRLGHTPLNYRDLCANWRRKMPSYRQLRRALSSRGAGAAAIVGIDLRSNPARPTGWAVCRGTRVETAVIFSDAEILARTLAERPTVVSIDAPLSLPRGRQAVSDDSPCRDQGGIVREAERVLWSRHIRVYPALIRQMQGLTARGIALAREFESHGIRVIESYPGAAQDVLNIPRKKADQKLLEKGLRQFGYRFAANLSHDELDAITSALVGHFYLAGAYEAIGADDEGYMVNPRLSNMRWNESAPKQTRAIFLTGLPGAGKTTVAKQLAIRLGWDCLLLGEELRKRAELNPTLHSSLNRGKLAPESLVVEIVSEAVRSERRHQVLVDGFPRHAQQLSFLDSTEADWQIIWLDIPEPVAVQRLQCRHFCFTCRHVGSESRSGRCPVCGSSEWQNRRDDVPTIAAERIRQALDHLEDMSTKLSPDRFARVPGDQPLRSVCAEVLRIIETL